ncbi:sarcosine oxidase subunit gamma [Citreimonas salinaria]|uniref:Sarcosine oxidase subunit gamma n=1 Tax=Citreimonas salinaria TaxID=321339 RepID=A0A1H3H261_9RHOB|nr:sarcosine oxidase subunit gamma family protein [Citreimonas salinaria]SDY09616.1 sarcosine oxidase subunit gamma [Citreimonas salinaria]
MSDPVLPLGGARFDGLIAVEEVPQGMVALRGSLDAEAVKAAVTELTGAAMPDPLRATRQGDHALLWMAPDELLILLPRADGPQAARDLADTLSGEHALVTDVSDARAVFALSGDDGRLRETLAKLTSADLSPGAFAPGTVRRTRLAQIPAALWLTEPGVARVLCFRSVARYAFDLLSEAGREGSAVEVL